MALTTIFDRRYITNASGALLSTHKQQRVVAGATAEGLVDIRLPEIDVPDIWQRISDVHALDYVNAVRTGHPKRLAQSQGFIWSPAFAEATVRVYGGQLAACRLAAAAGVVFHPVSGAHHAEYRTGGGFCTFNFLAGAAMAHAERSLIIDLDAHQGNGTYALVGGCPRIGLFDISHASWGVESQHAHQVYTVAENAEQYFQQLDALPAFLDSFKPTLVQYQAGVDCFERDHMGDIEGMSATMLAARDRFVIGEVMARQIPLVINLGGGYVTETVDLHIQTARVAVDVCHELFV